MGHPKTDETFVNTTRFRIYKRRATDYFSKDNYIHAQNVKGSAYLLINRKNKEPDIKNKIEKMIYKYWNTD